MFDHLLLRNKNMIDHKDPVFRAWLGDILKAEDVSVTFTKTDGTERVMKCTLREEVVKEYVKKGDRVRKGDSEALAVWDLESGAWRSFRYDSIKEIHFTLGSATK